MFAGPLRKAARDHALAGAVVKLSPGDSQAAGLATAAGALAALIASTGPLIMTARPSRSLAPSVPSEFIPPLVAQSKKHRIAMEKAMAVQAVAGRALVDAENALDVALVTAGGNVVGAAVALGIAELAGQVRRERCDAIAGRLGYLSLEQRVRRLQVHVTSTPLGRCGRIGEDSRCAVKSSLTSARMLDIT